MKRIFLLLFCFALPAAAQTADLKIGFVSMEKIQRESQLIAKADKKLEKEFQPRNQEIIKMRKQVKEVQTQLEKDSLTMSESDRTKKQKELLAMTREFQHTERALREDFNLRKNEELSGLNERLLKAITEIAEKEKYDMVLENAVYASPKVDITDRVLKALDR